MTLLGCFGRSASFMSKILYNSGVTSKMAELSVWISCKFLSIVYHVLYTFVRPISCRVIYIDWFKLNVKRWHVACVKTDNVFSNSRYFVFFLFLVVAAWKASNFRYLYSKIFWIFAFICDNWCLTINNLLNDRFGGRLIMQCSSTLGIRSWY